MLWLDITKHACYGGAKIMKVAIYSIETGAIIRKVSCPVNAVHIQAEYGEEFYLNCPPGATHIIDGEPATIIPATTPLTAEELLGAIRRQRNIRLSACDWTQIPDAPLLPDVKGEWAAYRQALRDFPETCDPFNPVWPVAPI